MAWHWALVIAFSLKCFLSDFDFELNDCGYYVLYGAQPPHSAGM